MIATQRHVADLGELDANEAGEIHRLTVDAIAALRRVYRPDAFNVGWNLGEVAGGSISGHLHQHVVPRWSGDTKFHAGSWPTTCFGTRVSARREAAPLPGRDCAP